MPKKKRRHGEYIQIDWDGCDPPYELVFGHVHIGEAFMAIASEHGARDVACWVANCSMSVEHGYARWNVSGNWSAYDQSFEPCDGPGRGRFKVTYVMFRERR